MMESVKEEKVWVASVITIISWYIVDGAVKIKRNIMAETTKLSRSRK
jgi:hypothetical protein